MYKYRKIPQIVHQLTLRNTSLLCIGCCIQDIGLLHAELSGNGLNDVLALSQLVHHKAEIRDWKLNYFILQLINVKIHSR